MRKLEINQLEELTERFFKEMKILKIWQFAIKYIPLPNPVIKTANIASMIFDSKLSGVETYFKQTSIIAAIIIAFKIVPIPGF